MKITHPRSSIHVLSHIRWKRMGFLLILSLVLASPLRAETMDRVVAVVNNTAITLSELNEAVSVFQLKLESIPKGPDATKDEGFQRKVLEELINKQIVDDFAAKSGIQASDQEVDRAVQDVLSRNRLTKDGLESALKQEGLSYDEYRKQLREQIVKMKLINQQIRPNVNVTEDAVREYYLNHPEKFQTTPGAVLKHILFRLPRSPDEKAVQEVTRKAQRVREEILKGKPFEEAAQQYSQDAATAGQGGGLGFFRMGDLIPEFKTGISGLKETEVSEPIRTAAGIHLIKLEERTTGNLRPFEKVKDDIHAHLFEDQGERYFQDWIKELRKNAYIEILL
jgi:peptidyl-prolyl cis-trans isomerase SurA